MLSFSIRKTDSPRCTCQGEEDTRFRTRLSVSCIIRRLSLYYPVRPLPMHPLDPSIRKIWAIKIAGMATVFLVVALFYDLVGLFGGDHLLPPGVATGLVLVFGGGAALGWPRLKYRAWRFDLRAEELYLERGVLNRVRTIVPLRRIQHLDVSQDLLEREFSLGKLIVHTAGTRSADVAVPGLRYEEAERLRDTVRRYLLDVKEDVL